MSTTDLTRYLRCTGARPPPEPHSQLHRPPVLRGVVRDNGIDLRPRRHGNRHDQDVCRLQLHGCRRQNLLRAHVRQRKLHVPQRCAEDAGQHNVHRRDVHAGPVLPRQLLDVPVQGHVPDQHRRQLDSVLQRSDVRLHGQVGVLRALVLHVQPKPVPFSHAPTPQPHHLVRHSVLLYGGGRRRVLRADLRQRKLHVPQRCAVAAFHHDVHRRDVHSGPVLRADVRRRQLQVRQRRAADAGQHDLPGRDVQERPVLPRQLWFVHLPDRSDWLRAQLKCVLQLPHVRLGRRVDVLLGGDVRHIPHVRGEEKQGLRRAVPGRSEHVHTGHLRE